MATLIPENAPFSAEQRAWLDGFFAALLNGEHATQGGNAPANTEVAEESEDHPWHDATLTLDERMALAADAKPELRLMAATAQLDCGQCGYLCRSYAEAVWSGAEQSLSRCVPGARETSRALKALMAELADRRPAESTNGANGHAAPSATGTAAAPSRERPVLARLIEARPLCRDGSDKDVRHVALDIAGTGLSYRPGDSLGIVPRLNPILVRAVLDRLGASGEEMVAVGGEAMALREALASRVDIARPSEDAIALLAQSARDEAEAATLAAIAAGDGPADLADADLLELLDAFSSARPASGTLVAALLPLQPRLYSIASSPAAHPGEVHLTVSAVRWNSRGRPRSGVGSCYLADIAAPGGIVPVFVQTAHGFRLPADPATPVIMVGPGTGIAPFRAFLAERAATGASGRSWLFFGDRRRASDYLYEDEIEAWRGAGALHRLDLAFSRDQEEKVYVQTRMREQARELWSWLQDGAHFYVCGDAKAMARDVDKALHDIAAEQGGLTAEAAKAWVADLARAGRYQRDVY
jgi:sulfite reductase (NADPH) flavoprotein alpha-component